MENTNSFVNAVNLSDYRAFSYSGRCMYGSRCFAIDLGASSPMDFFADILEFGELIEEGMYGMEVLAEAMRNSRTDSLGRGTVLYFPHIKFTREDEDIVGLDDED